MPCNQNKGGGRELGQAGAGAAPAARCRGWDPLGFQPPPGLLPACPRGAETQGQAEARASCPSRAGPGQPDLHRTSSVGPGPPAARQTPSTPASVSLCEEGLSQTPRGPPPGSLGARRRKRQPPLPSPCDTCFADTRQRLGTPTRRPGQGRAPGTRRAATMGPGKVQGSRDTPGPCPALLTCPRPAQTPARSTKARRGDPGPSQATRPPEPPQPLAQPYLPATYGPPPARPGRLPKERPAGAASQPGRARGPTTGLAPPAPGWPARGPAAPGAATWWASRLREPGKGPGRRASQPGGWELARQPSSPFPGPPGPPPSPRHL